MPQELARCKGNIQSCVLARSSFIVPSSTYFIHIPHCGGPHSQCEPHASGGAHETSEHDDFISFTRGGVGGSIWPLVRHAGHRRPECSRHEWARAGSHDVRNAFGLWSDERCLTYHVTRAVSSLVVPTVAPCDGCESAGGSDLARLRMDSNEKQHIVGISGDAENPLVRHRRALFTFFTWPAGMGGPAGMSECCTLYSFSASRSSAKSQRTRAAPGGPLATPKTALCPSRAW